MSHMAARLAISLRHAGPALDRLASLGTFWGEGSNPQGPASMIAAPVASAMLKNGIRNAVAAAASCPDPQWQETTIRKDRRKNVREALALNPWLSPQAAKLLFDTEIAQDDSNRTVLVWAIRRMSAKDAFEARMLDRPELGNARGHWYRSWTDTFDAAVAAAVCSDPEAAAVKSQTLAWACDESRPHFFGRLLTGLLHGTAGLTRDDVDALMANVPAASHRTAWFYGWATSELDEVTARYLVTFSAPNPTDSPSLFFVPSANGLFWGGYRGNGLSGSERQSETWGPSVWCGTTAEAIEVIAASQSHPAAEVLAQREMVSEDVAIRIAPRLSPGVASRLVGIYRTVEMWSAVPQASWDAIPSRLTVDLPAFTTPLPDELVRKVMRYGTRLGDWMLVTEGAAQVTEEQFMLALNQLDRTEQTRLSHDVADVLKALSPERRQMAFDHVPGLIQRQTRDHHTMDILVEYLVSVLGVDNAEQWETVATLAPNWEGSTTALAQAAKALA